MSYTDYLICLNGGKVPSKITGYFAEDVANIHYSRSDASTSNHSNTSNTNNTSTSLSASASRSVHQPLPQSTPIIKQVAHHREYCATKKIPELNLENNEEIFNYLDDAAQGGDHEATAYLGYMYEYDYGTKKMDLEKAAKLYRIAHSKGINFATQRLKDLYKIAQYNPQGGAYYHTTIALKFSCPSFYIKDRNKFITLLAQDQLLNLKEKFVYMDQLFGNMDLSNIAFIKSDSEFIGEYLCYKADTLIAMHVPENEYYKKQANIQKALNIYKNIDKQSSAWGKACYGIAIHAMGLNGWSFQSFKEARKYLREGTELGDESCKELYFRILQTILSTEKTDYLEENIDIQQVIQLEKKYGSFVTSEVLNDFIKKHHLDDLKYLASQTKGPLGGVRIGKYRVPHHQAKMIHIIEDKNLSSKNKIDAIEKIGKEVIIAYCQSNNPFKFFKDLILRSNNTKNCYQEALILNQTLQCRL